jgi:hypothetical protein
MKTGLEPQYDDIFNNVFSKKTPQAQINAERTDARLNAIKKKFNFNQGNDYTDEKWLLVLTLINMLKISSCFMSMEVLYLLFY